MLTITNGFTYIAFLMLLAGGLLALEKYMKWKIFNIVPPLVWIYIFNMFFCTIGLYNSDECSAAYSALKNNILYAMIFVMLLRCDFRKLGKLGPRMICIFMGCAITLGIGFFALFPLFANALGGADKTWGATAALYASWVGGSANMAAMEDALPVDSGAYSCALALDTACYSLWIALLLFAVKYAQKWNKACKADTSKLDAVAAAANEEVAKETNVKPNAADWIFLIGLTLVVSAVSQYIGVQMNGFFKGVGLSFFDKGTCTTVFVTILGLICAMTPLGKLPAVTELSSVLSLCGCLPHRIHSNPDRPLICSDVGCLWSRNPSCPCCADVHPLQDLPLGSLHGFHRFRCLHRRICFRSDHRNRL